MKKTGSKELKFEDALDRLENIISMLQEGDLSLEESLDFFQEGTVLVKACHEKLENAETKVSILLKDSEGKISEAPFQPESER